MEAMTIPHRLDKVTGNLAAIEAAFMLLALRLARSELLCMDGLIDDLDMLASVPCKDPDIEQAELRMITTLRRLQIEL